MKREQLKSIIKEVLKEGSFEDTLKKIGLKPDMFHKEPEKLPGWKDELPKSKRPISPEKPKTPPPQSHFKIGPAESTEPSIGGSYKDQQTTMGGNVRPEFDPLNDPLLKEYSDPEKRRDAIKSSAYDRSNPNKFLNDQYRGAKLIYQWVKNGTIDFKEFKDLIELLAAVNNSL